MEKLTWSRLLSAVATTATTTLAAFANGGGLANWRYSKRNPTERKFEFEKQDEAEFPEASIHDDTTFVLPPPLYSSTPNLQAGLSSSKRKKTPNKREIQLEMSLITRPTDSSLHSQDGRKSPMDGGDSATATLKASSKNMLRVSACTNRGRTGVEKRPPELLQDAEMGPPTKKSRRKVSTVAGEPRKLSKMRRKQKQLSLPEHSFNTKEQRKQKDLCKDYEYLILSEDEENIVGNTKCLKIWTGKDQRSLKDVTELDVILDFLENKTENILKQMPLSDLRREFVVKFQNYIKEYFIEIINAKSEVKNIKELQKKKSEAKEMIRFMEKTDRLLFKRTPGLECLALDKQRKVLLEMKTKRLILSKKLYEHQERETDKTQKGVNRSTTDVGEWIEKFQKLKDEVNQ